MSESGENPDKRPNYFVIFLQLLWEKAWSRVTRQSAENLYSGSEMEAQQRARENYDERKKNSGRGTQ